MFHTISMRHASMPNGMENRSTESVLRRSVLVAGIGLLFTWVAFHVDTLTSTQNGWIRFVLTFVFGVLILLRPKPTAAALGTQGYTSLVATVIASTPGASLVLMGSILGVHQLEWLGILLLVWACLRWGLPDEYGRDLSYAMALLYFAHPLPAQLFGPLQLAMQRASVAGSEWLLLGLDVRVWANELALYTGFGAYEVPGWCSGMRTATTVLLLGLALCILNRFRWQTSAVVLAAALIQALALNILRISVMVVVVPRFVDKSHSEFLHDTSGAIVLAAVFLVYAEILAWRRYQHRKEAVEALDGAIAVDDEIARPMDLQKMRAFKWVIALAIVLGITLAVMGARNTPKVRLSVLKDVATAARDSNRFEEALAMVTVISEEEPRNEEWKATKVRLLLVLQRFYAVLAETAEVSPSEGQKELRILRAYALMAVNRLDEASEIVRGLPGSVQRANPRVAMILAVMAHDADDPDGVARHVILANRWEPNRGRVARLFPYLRHHRRWDVIARCDSDMLHEDAGAAFSAAEAFMNLDDSPRVAALLDHMIRKWPGDPRILEPLYFMTVKRPDGPWESRFRDQLIRSARGIENPDTLYALFEKCFQMGRPDLAWFLYRRVEELDAEHPMLHWIIYRYGHEWFTFRRRALGLPSSTPHSRSDLSSLFVLGRIMRGWDPFCSLVPAGNTLSSANTAPTRRDHLKRAVRAFRKQREDESLSLDMHYLYAHTLELSGAYRDSLSELRAIRLAHPEERGNVRIARSEMLERLGDWDGVYETLREYPHDTDRLLLAPLLRLGRAQFNLEMNLSAEFTAREAQRQYPRSAQAATFLAKVLLANGASEEAVFLFEHYRGRHIRDLDLLQADALFQTERFREAETFSNDALIPRPPVYGNTQQRYFLPRAAASAIWHHTQLPTERAFRINASVLATNRASIKSDYLKGVMSEWVTTYHSATPIAQQALDQWEALGRDRTEKAAALHQLTLLLCHRRDYDLAGQAARRAAELLPEASMLWRWCVSLSRDQEADVLVARQHCPGDPELWLVELGYRAQEEPDAVMAFIRPYAQGEPRMPVGTQTRAADMLHARGLIDEACVLMRNATRRARGLLPAFVLGIQCATDIGDKDWALFCTKQAIDAALRPPSQLYKRLIDLRVAGNELPTDADVVEALKSLRSREPENLVWAQMLGYVRFRRGGWEMPDAFRQMEDALIGGATNRLAFSVAAEASRQLGNNARAAEILKRGLEYYPNDITFLNNLTHLLADTPNGITEAQSYVPQLMKRGGDSVDILDTVATVLMKSGKTDIAEATALRLLQQAPEGGSIWFRANMHLAQIRAEAGDWTGAIAKMTAAMKNATEVDDETVVEANRRLSQWRRRHAEETQPIPQIRPESLDSL